MRGPSPPAPELLLGPLLRYAGTENATFWVETSAPCDVGILGHRARTFSVEGHHYALVVANDLEPASVTPYDVRLDGRLVWPPRDGRPRPVVHTRHHEDRARLVFGSCRVGGPQPTRLTRPWPEDLRELGIDALWTYSKQLQRGEAEWPDALFLLGDQVYADEVSPATLEFIESRRDTTVAPGRQIADFEEYTRLYRESWADPEIRWLFSTVPTAMIFDDHDVHDDWNMSWRWVQEMRSKPWWEARITGAFMSYWIYQHLGNLSPPELAEETMFQLVQEDEDAGPRLRRFAQMCDHESAACRWAYFRDFGNTRLLVVDSRAARVLAEDRREMVDAEEWDWIVDQSAGSFDHVIVASTLPVFLPHGLHHLEAWTEALCDGRWGRLVASISERFRRTVDLEHWAAFNESFERLCGWLQTVRAGARDDVPPATILLLGGDVHHAYVSEIEFDSNPGSRVYQLVCSPFRNPLPPRERRIVRVTGSRAAGVAFAALARIAGVRVPSASWRSVRNPTFDNSIGELVLEGRSARVTVRRSPHEDEDVDRLVVLHRTDLALDTLSEATPGPREGVLDDAHAHG